MVYNLTLFFLLSIIILSQLIEMYKIPVDNLTLDFFLNENTQKIINDFFVDLGYKGVYIYSLLQLKYNAASKYLLPYLENIKQQIQKKDDNEITTHIELICKDGTVINKVIISKLLEDVKKDDIKTHLNDTVELMIITDYNKKDTNASNKICMSKNIDEISNCDVSNIKFIDLTVTYNGDIHKIHLKNDEHNFYIVNNKIDETFLKYYLMNILKINIDDKFKYDLQLIDHEVNISLLDNNHSIIIEKDSYRIESKKDLNNQDTLKHDNKSENQNILEEEIKSSQDDLSEEFEKIEKLDNDN